MTSLFKIGPKDSAEVLPTIHKCKKAVVCLMDKICVLDKFLSGMSSSVNESAVSCEFNVNESTIYVTTVCIHTEFFLDLWSKLEVIFREKKNEDQMGTLIDDFWFCHWVFIFLWGEYTCYLLENHIFLST